jgi:Asparagine synthase (glutamine-hydrolyzing)
LSTYEHEASGLAIALSGGVDSSLLLSVYAGSVTSYCVGGNNTEDEKYAHIMCDFLNQHLRVIGITPESVHECTDIVHRIDPAISRMDLGFETVLALILSNIQEDGLITGQGADEIFYGYAKFRDGRENTNESSIKKLMERTLKREQNIASYFGKYLLTPYLDREIVKAFADLPGTYHMDGRRGKRIVREAAVKRGLPEIICERSKKAAQYGSGIQKVIRKYK